MPEENENQGNSPTPPGHLLRHATFRQLQVFEAIYRLGSFTKAAEELFLTQPTASSQMKKLTEAAGLPLFEQVGRNVRPTDAGTHLYQACRQIFSALNDLEVRFDELKGLKRGRLHMAVITTAKYLTPEMLGDFSLLYPDIELSLKVTNRDRVLERMLADEDDLYILGHSPPHDIDSEVYPFAPNPLVIMAPRHHPLVNEKNIPFERIASEPFIIREPGSGIRDATLRAFSSAGYKPKIRMELGSNEAIKHAVVGGLGLSVLSLHSLALEGSEGPLAVLDVEGFPIWRQWYLLHRKNKDLSFVASAFLRFAVQYEIKIRDRMLRTWPDLKIRKVSQKSSKSHEP